MTCRLSGHHPATLVYTMAIAHKSLAIYTVTIMITHERCRPLSRRAIDDFPPTTASVS